MTQRGSFFKTRIFMFFPCAVPLRSKRTRGKCALSDAGSPADPTAREAECFLHHPVRLSGVDGSSTGSWRIWQKMPRILLCLRRNRPRIIRGKYDEASLHAKIGKAHQRIRGHGEPHLLHRHQYARACEAGAPPTSTAAFFVGRPPWISPGLCFRNRFQHFRRRRARISAQD